MLAADLITDCRAAYFHSFFVLNGFSQFSVSAHSTVRLRQQPAPAGLEFLNLYREAELDAEGSDLRISRQQCQLLQMSSRCSRS